MTAVLRRTTLLFELGRRWWARSPLPCGCVVVPQPQLNFKTPPKHPKTAARRLQDASRLPPDGFWLSTSSAGGNGTLCIKSSFPTRSQHTSTQLPNVSRASPDFPWMAVCFQQAHPGERKAPKSYFGSLKNTPRRCQDTPRQLPDAFKTP